MNEKLSNIDITESYILGWKVIDDKLIMYVDLYLKDTHEKFKAFDPDTEFGCLKLGVLKFYDVRGLEGLDQKQVLPKWNERLGEYEDVEEINAMDLLRNYMFIETDTKIVRFSFRDFDIEILNSSNFVI